jgi:two-component system NtrC family sensor kinase
VFLQGAKAVFFIPPLIGFFILVCLALVSLLRGRRNPTNLLFAGICFLGSLLNGNFVLVSLIPSQKAALFIYRLTYFFFVFSLPLYIQFTHAFLGIYRRKYVEQCAYFISLACLYFVPSSLFFSGFYEYDFGRIARGGPLFYLFATMAVGSVFYCIMILIQGMKRAGDNQQRNRIKYITGGLGLGALLMCFNILPVMGFYVYPMGNFNFLPAVILAFGVLKYDLLDMGVIIRRGLVYFALTGILALIYFCIIYFMSYLLMESGLRNSLLSLGLAVTIVFLFNPLQTRIQAFLDRIFFMGKYNYQEILKEISGQMNRLRKFTEIRDLLLDSALNHIRVKAAYLIIRWENTGEIRYFGRGEVKGAAFAEKGTAAMPSLVKCLEGIHVAVSKPFLERILPEDHDKATILGLMDTLGAVAAVPMAAKDRLLGVMFLGEKQSGELLVHEDLEVLITMANQAVTSMENAMYFERLEALNQELESRVIERTAALHRALEEKERTKEQLIRSESLAAIGQLVAGTAHELNNPLASASSLIQSAVESVATGPWGETEKNDLVDDLKFSLKELKRAGDIVRSLLGLSRQTDTYREPVRIHDLIDDALRVIYNLYRHLPVTIEKEYGASIPEVEGNFASLGQVMLNIVKNAFQSLPESGGIITLTTRYDDTTEDLTIACIDTGRGIPEHQLKDIFKPFFTTKEVGEGTGLGLYLSHELVRRHGGDMTVESHIGRGSTFTIRLPRTRREK